MDYRVYHSINHFVYQHAWLGRGLSVLETWAVPVVAIATFALWLLARPGGSSRWKLASACALASAALALLINQLIGKVWHRERPFASHPSAHVWGSRSHDPSFPSDHVSAALRHRLRDFSLRPSRRLHLPRRGLRDRRRPRPRWRPLPGRCTRRLPGRPRFGTACCPSRKTIHGVARRACRARDRSAACTALASTRAALKTTSSSDLAPPQRRRSTTPAKANAGTATKMLHHLSVATAIAAAPIAIVAASTDDRKRRSSR